MGLSFTHIVDRDGPAIYLVGNRMIETDLQEKAREIDTALGGEIQVVYIDSEGGDGAQITEFYGIMQEQLPVIMIVQDDDTIYKSWEGQDLPAADQVAYEIRQIVGTV